jgi:signal transduction histidine kinase
MTAPTPHKQVAADVLVALAATVSTFVAVAIQSETDGGSMDATTIVLIGAAGVSLIWRRRWPIAVLTVVVACHLLVTIDSGSEIGLTAALIVALYTVARLGNRRTALLVASLTAIGSAIAATAIHPGESFAAEIIGELGIVLLPVAVGDALRTREERLADRIETEAQARVQAERLRIARDLHDVVAHGLSTISVQSGIAAHLMDTNPDHARQALEVINTTGKHTLEELRAMVGVLRSTDETPLRPTPNDPNDLTDLISGAQAAGLDVHTIVTGTFPPDVSDASVVAAHRILQEALTNVIRHAGPVPVNLRLTHGREELTMDVQNQPGAPATANGASTGVGIVGMTERAESIGGKVTAAPTADGGFTVQATLPYRRHP